MNSNQSELASEAGYTRMELTYCERCGALRVLPARETGRFCTHCTARLEWIGVERVR